ncbi:MAG: leucyl/phenylalanyl-tRNA--protein transferase [Microscillaceae bacterium]|nr:leucyl/phenylalanyl-tRNA--protein transferase [Microscillaceae bacterium]
MFYHFLDTSLYFPPLEQADEEGILALGGDLSLPRLLLAYRSGIFPWYSPGEPIIWWAPDPRFVLYPHQLRVSKSMRPYLNGKHYQVSLDQDFAAVISACRHTPRPGQSGTWITDEMQKAYIALHEAGYAHSVEVWQETVLVGGLYGVSMGGCFFGESMFSRASNASKTGFIKLVQLLSHKGFTLIDCQVYTQHLESLGGQNVARERFMEDLSQALAQATWQGRWTGAM